MWGSGSDPEIHLHLKTSQHPGRSIPSVFFSSPSETNSCDNCQETKGNPFSVPDAMFFFSQISWKQTTSSKRCKWSQSDITIVAPFFSPNPCLQYIYLSAYAEPRNQENAKCRPSNDPRRACLQHTTQASEAGEIRTIPKRPTVSTKPDVAMERPLSKICRFARAQGVIRSIAIAFL